MVLIIYFMFFLQKYMPSLAAIFPHTLIDVSSVMALCIRWFPKGNMLCINLCPCVYILTCLKDMLDNLIDGVSSQ